MQAKMTPAELSNLAALYLDLLALPVNGAKREAITGPAKVTTVANAGGYALIQFTDPANPAHVFELVAGGYASQAIVFRVDLTAPIAEVFPPDSRIGRAIAAALEFAPNGPEWRLQFCFNARHADAGMSLSIKPSPGTQIP